MSEREKLEEALRWLLDRSRPSAYDIHHVGVLEGAIRAHLATLPKTRMVEVETWRVEWTSRVGTKWDPRSDSYTNHGYAVQRFESLKEIEGEDLRCVRLLGPFVHQQEVPA